MTNGPGNPPSWANFSAMGTALTAINLANGVWGSVPYQSAANTTSMLAPGANGQVLMSQGPGANVAWDPVSYPLATTINQILYSNGANTVTGLATQNSGILVTSAGGAPSIGTDIPATVTIGGGNYIYRAGGTQIPFSDGGTNANLSLLPVGGLIYMGAGPALAGVSLTGLIKGNGALAPTAMNGTAGQTAYWVDANTIGSEASVPMAQGGTGMDLSGLATGALIYKAAGSLNGVALTGVLQGTGGVPAALNGTAGYNTYWTDANTIGSEQFIPLANGGSNADLPLLATGSLIYKAAGSLNGVALTGVLQGTGGVPAAMNGTANYPTFWSDANTIAAEQFVPLANGGTNADLHLLATGSLIYKAAGSLAGATLTGVLQGTGGVPAAMNGTANYNTYWSDANTIAAEQYTAIARGGTGSNLPSAATGGLIYKNSATTLDGTAALTGVIKRNRRWRAHSHERDRELQHLLVGRQHHRGGAVHPHSERRNRFEPPLRGYRGSDLQEQRNDPRRHRGPDRRPQGNRRWRAHSHERDRKLQHLLVGRQHHRGGAIHRHSERWNGLEPPLRGHRRFDL